jgi:beta-phosphoglucomutase-like phosphatase (HAD superfamily)
MVTVVLFDLGDTLVDGSRPFPHAPEALSAISRFKTATGEPLQFAVVSDFTMAAAPGPDAVAAIFAEYLGLLDGFGLRGFFTPVERRVTLSTHAGVMKPDRRVYELALRRLGGGASVADCLSVTENAEHIAACRAMGMRTLRFGVDFTDWAEFPLLLRRLLDPADEHNAAIAMDVWLAAHTDVQLVSIQGPVSAGTAELVVRPRAGGAPRRATVSFDAAGKVANMTDQDDNPGPGEEQLFEESLREHGQLADEDAEELPPGATHRAVTDEQGNKVIRRDRFSAF